MIVIEWEGLACGKSEKWGRTKTGLTFVTKKYKIFVKAIKAEAMVAMRGSRTWERHEWVNVIIKVEVGPLRDHHNLVEPILDALQGVVFKNDLYVADLIVPMAKRHKRGQLDRITICIDKREDVA